MEWYEYVYLVGAAVSYIGMCSDPALHPTKESKLPPILLTFWLAIFSLLWPVTLPMATTFGGIAAGFRLWVPRKKD
jgi:hypothetical protein